MGNNCCQPEDADQVNQRKPPNRRAEPASKGGFVELEEVDHATMGNSQSHKSSDQNSSNRALVNDLEKLEAVNRRGGQQPAAAPTLPSTVAEARAAGYSEAQINSELNRRTSAGSQEQVEDPNAPLLSIAEQIQQKEAAKAKAIRSEDYETAACLRDDIRRLQGHQADAARDAETEAALEAAEAALINATNAAAFQKDLTGLARDSVAAEPTAIDAIWTEDRLQAEGINIRIDECVRSHTLEAPDLISPISTVGNSSMSANCQQQISAGDLYLHHETAAQYNLRREEEEHKKQAAAPGRYGLEQPTPFAKLEPAAVAAKQAAVGVEPENDYATQLRQMCKQTLQKAIAADVEDGNWETGKPPKGLVNASLNFQVKQNEGREMVLVRVRCVINVPPSKIAQVSLQGGGLPKGTTGMMVEELDPHLKLNWLMVKVPIVSNREFVYASWVDIQENKTHLVQCSIDVEESEKYNPIIGAAQKWKKSASGKIKSPNVRGRIVLQASIIDPLPGGKSQLTWLSCVDPGGKLPTAKQTTAKKAAESVLALQTYCLKH